MMAKDAVKNYEIISVFYSNNDLQPTTNAKKHFKEMINKGHNEKQKQKQLEVVS